MTAFHVRRIILAISLPAAIIATLLLLYVLIHPGPEIVRDSQGEATVVFSADPGFVIRSSTCVTLYWKVESIRTVYLNGQGKTGEGTEVFCPSESQAAPVLEVNLRDGTKRSYKLSIPSVFFSPDVLLLSGILILFTGLAVVASKQDWLLAFFAGRIQILGIDRNLVLLVWIFTIICLYWLINDPSGLDSLVGILSAIRSELQHFFSAPYLG